ncbi:MAG: glycosyltransferase, partial [Saprospiraceae bacterium]
LTPGPSPNGEGSMTHPSPFGEGPGVRLGALYIGTRPTLSPAGKRVIEVHLLDFDGDLYGQNLRVEVVDFIRPDKKLDNLEDLKKQIEEDKAEIQRRLATYDLQSTVNSQESRVNGQKSTVNSQEPTVKSQESRVNGQESTVKSQESTVKSQKSTVKSQESTVKSQEPTVKSQESTVKSQKSKVAVVILNYNTRRHLEQFLPSVVANSAGARIIVADNGSPDDSVEFLQNHYPEVELIDLQQNWGFAEGYNRALRQVEAEIYVILNSDVEVAPGWLEPVLEAMKKDPGMAVAQPKILAWKGNHSPTNQQSPITNQQSTINNQQSTINNQQSPITNQQSPITNHQSPITNQQSTITNQQSAIPQFEYAGAAGGWIDRLGYPFCRGRIFSQREEDSGQYDTAQECFWAAGAAFFIRADLYHAFGGFDGDYFAHNEEIDLCWRLKRAGYGVWCIPQSVVWHLGGGTLEYENPRKVFLNFRNSLYSLLKNEPWGKLLWLIPARVLLDGLAGARFAAKGQYRAIWAIVRGHFSFYNNFRTTLRKRREVMEIIAKHKIAPKNSKGIFPGSIIVAHYLRRVKVFREL